MILNSFQHRRCLIKMKNNSIREGFNSLIPRNTIYNITDKSIAMQVIDDYVPVKNLIVKDKKKKKDEYTIEKEDHSDSEDEIEEKVKEEYEEVEDYDTAEEGDNLDGEEEGKEEEEEDNDFENVEEDLKDLEQLQVDNIDLADLEKEMFGLPMEEEKPKEGKKEKEEKPKEGKPKECGNIKTILVKESFF